MDGELIVIFGFALAALWIILHRPGRRRRHEAPVSEAGEDDSAAEQEKRPARRYYELTPTGLEKLAEARSRFRGLEMMIQPARGRP